MIVVFLVPHAADGRRYNARKIDDLRTIRKKVTMFGGSFHRQAKGTILRSSCRFPYVHVTRYHWPAVRYVVAFRHRVTATSINWWKPAVRCDEVSHMMVFLRQITAVVDEKR